MAYVLIRVSIGKSNKIQTAALVVIALESYLHCFGIYSISILFNISYPFVMCCTSRPISSYEHFLVIA